jgi:ribosomal protein S18 acetylase RimI-like enzyme
MASDPTVRRATAADAAEVARLMYDFNTEFDEPIPEVPVLAERYAELLESGDLTVLLIGEGPDGFAQLRCRPWVYSRDLDAYLEELYVVPARRGQGLGRTLLEAAMEEARGRGAVHFELTTAETDTSARRLYDSAGFTNREGSPDGPVMLYYERDL